MSHKQNLHTHTTYVDGKDSPEDLIVAALEKGFDSIGFSEHSYLTYSNYPHQMPPADMVRYKAEIGALKQKYKGQIDVFCGLELDYYSDVDTAGLNYLIGSVHYLDCGSGIFTFDRGLDSTRDYINDHFGGESLRFAKKYFETLATFPEKQKIDIIGHFDLIAKNNDTGHFFDENSKEYLDLGFEAIHALRGKCPFFEMSTGAMVNGYRTIPYPQLAFLGEFKRCGFGAVITSDCHNKMNLDGHFDKAREQLLAAGFTSKWILTEHGFKEVPL